MSNFIVNNSDLATSFIALIVAITTFIKSHTNTDKIIKDRAETKAHRDTDSFVIHDKIMKHDFEIEHIKDEVKQTNIILDGLHTQINQIGFNLCKVQTSLDFLTESIKELKCK